MSDEALRELERAWRQERTPDSETRYLSEALRAGALPRRRVELAAYLEHPPAIEVVGKKAPCDPGEHPEIWTRRLAPYGAEAIARLCLGEGRRLAQLVSASIESGGAPLEASTWLRIGTSVEEAISASLIGDRDTERLVSVRRSSLFGPFLQNFGDWSDHATTMRSVLNAGAASLQFGKPELPRLGRGVSASGFLSTLRAELVPWCTGDYDPVRRRAEGVLEQIEIASPCGASWEAMQGDDRVRRCGTCDRDVFDLSSLDRAEAEALLTGQGAVCVRLYKRSDGTVMTRDCAPGLEARVRVLPQAPSVTMGSVAPALPVEGPDPV